MTYEEFLNGEVPFDSGDFNTLHDLIMLLKKLHSPCALNLEKTYNRLFYLEQKEKIQEGVRAADNGELVEHVVVAAPFKSYDVFRANLKAAIKAANNNYEKVTAIHVNANEYRTNKFLDIPVFGDHTVSPGEFVLKTEKTVLRLNQVDI